MAAEPKGHVTWLLKDREELIHQTKRKVLQVEGTTCTKAWPWEALPGASRFLSGRDVGQGEEFSCRALGSEQQTWGQACWR